MMILVSSLSDKDKACRGEMRDIGKREGSPRIGVRTVSSASFSRLEIFITHRNNIQPNCEGSC